MAVISDLLPYEKNPRIISDKQFNMLKDSLDKLGDLSGIVFNRRNKRLVGGHQRMKVLEPYKPLLVTEVERETPDGQGTVATGYLAVEVNGKHYRYVYREVDWDDETHEQAMIKANRLGGDWDTSMLQNNWDTDTLVEWGFDNDEVEWNLLDPEETEGDDDSPDPDSIKEPLTVNGDLYELGRHRIMCGDSTVITDVEKLMCGEKADMVFTDPPYALTSGGHNHRQNNPLRMGILGNDKKNTGKLFEIPEPNDWISKLPTKENCDVYIMFNDKNARIFLNVLHDNKIKIHNLLVMEKSNSVPNKWYLKNCEYTFYGFTGKSSKGINDMSSKTCEKIQMIMGNEKVHVSQKTVGYILGKINNSSDKNQIVHDPFLGSGSALIACEKTERKCYGMEIDETYCDVVVKRYVDFCKKNKIDYSVKRNGEAIDDFG